LRDRPHPKRTSETLHRPFETYAVRGAPRQHSKHEENPTNQRTDQVPKANLYTSRRNTPTKQRRIRQLWDEERRSNIKREKHTVGDAKGERGTDLDRILERGKYLAA